MSAIESLKQLENCINIEFYIGKSKADEIRKACKPITKKVVKKDAS